MHEGLAARKIASAGGRSELIEKNNEIKRKNSLLRSIAVQLKAIGEDPEREGLKDTPQRVAKMYSEILTYPEFKCTTFEDKYDDLVIVKNIEFCNADTDYHALSCALASKKIRLGNKTTGESVDLSTMDNATAVDKNTVKFTLNKPDSTFSDKLLYVGIVPSDSYNNETYGTNPVGSGPFKFVQWDKGQQVIGCGPVILREREKQLKKEEKARQDSIKKAEKEREKQLKREEKEREDSIKAAEKAREELEKQKEHEKEEAAKRAEQERKDKIKAKEEARKQREQERKQRAKEREQKKKEEAKRKKEEAKARKEAAKQRQKEREEARKQRERERKEAEKNKGKN